MKIDIGRLTDPREVREAISSLGKRNELEVERTLLSSGAPTTDQRDEARDQVRDAVEKAGWQPLSDWQLAKAASIFQDAGEDDDVTPLDAAHSVVKGTYAAPDAVERFKARSRRSQPAPEGDPAA